MLEALMKIFGKKEETGKIARDRLKVVLIHDRANISPEVMDNLTNDIIKDIVPPICREDYYRGFFSYR